MLVIGFKLVAGAIASNAFTGVAIGVGFIFASLVYSISRNPSQRETLMYKTYSVSAEAAETAVVLYLFIVSGKCLGIINIRYN